MSKLSILRIYDNALKHFVQQYVGPQIPSYDTGDLNETDHDVTENVHIATYDRPYGFEIPTDPKTGDVDTKRAESMLIKPQIAITRGDLLFSSIRNQTNPWRSIRPWDENNDFTVSAEHPRPWDLSYTIDVYGRLRNDCQKLIEYFLYVVNPVLAFRIQFCYPWDEQYISMMFNNIVDATQYEPGEGMRIYHYRIPLIMEAWMFGAYENPGDIRPGSLYPADNTRRVRTVKKIRWNLVGCWDCKVIDSFTFDLTAAGPTIEDDVFCCPDGVIQ